MAHKCKRCSVAFPSKNRLHSHIREYYIKTISSKNRLNSHIRECHIKEITLFSNSTAAPHICSVALVSASGKPFNQTKEATFEVNAVDLYISAKHSKCTLKSIYISLDSYKSNLSLLNKDESIAFVATAATTTATNKISTSSYAAKEIAFASKS